MDFDVSTQPENTQSGAAAMPVASTPNSVGAILLGGAHGALGIARALGRNGVNVVFITDDHPLPKLSRYVRSRFDWAGPGAPNALNWLLDLAETESLKGWLLIPCADGDVQFIAEHRTQLSQTFRVTSCAWDVLETLCDKQLLPQSAAKAGVDCPKFYTIHSEDAARNTDILFPVVLKPATRETANAFTLAKAWKAETREEFVEKYRDGARLVGARHVVVQELVPGGGEAQFSYAGVWHRGAPIADLMARRTRQYPVEFSYTSTFVEIIDRPDIREAAHRLLKGAQFEGLVEVEFKYDAREGRAKVLDVNPRAWSWLALAESAGINLPLILFQLATGAHMQPQQTPRAAAWIHLMRDGVAALQLMRRGELSVSDYWRSLWRQKLTFASFAIDDPLPGLCEIPLTLYRVLTRRLPLLFRRAK